MAKLALVRSVVGAIDDRMNPIVVKELRQAVNSMFVNTILLLFLVVLLLVLGGYLLLSETGRTNAGGEVFMVLHAIMLSTCLLFTPLYVGIRLGCERSGVNTDLLFITTIKPSSIVWGKLISGMAIAMLIFSACAPFMVITYLMRGIDLPTIFLILGLDVLVILGVIQVALTVASMPVSAVVKAFVGLAALGGIGMLCVGVLVMAAELAIDGVLFYGASAMDFWGPVITMILFGLAIAGLLFFVAVAMLTASTANRARPLRLYITAVWLVTGVIAVAHDWGFLPDLYFNAVEVWTITSLIFLSLILVCSGSEREAYGNRLLWKVPRRVWLRPIAFLTTSGAAAGLIWAGMLIAATIVTAWVCSSMHGPAHLTGSSSPYSVWGRQPLDFTRDIAYALPVPVYALAYILTGILLRKGLMGQGANPITAAAFAFLLMIVFTILPFIGLFVVMGDDWDRASDVWYILNPFATLSHEPGSEYWVLALIFSGAWAGITLLFLTPWMLRQIRSYRPLSPQAPETAAPVTPGDARG